MACKISIFVLAAEKEINKMNYKTTKWKKKRKHILMLDGYKDVLEARYGRMKEATIVHHIYPAEKYPEYEYCDWNLISVSEATHNKLENRQTRELTTLGRELMQRTIPGVNWRQSPLT